MNMHILKNLRAEFGRAPFVESPGALVGLLENGHMRTVKLCADGLVISRAGKKLALPLGELLKLARAHEPKVRQPRSRRREKARTTSRH